MHIGRAATQLLLAVFCLSLVGSAWAQQPPTTAPSPQNAPAPELLAAANALGMVRGAARGRDLTAVHFVLYSGSGAELRAGKMQPLTRYELTADYTVPALRIDATADNPSQRSVTVVSGRRAWDETSPGVSPVERKAAVAAQRLLQIYATPMGAITAALQADPKQLSIEKVDGKVVIGVQKDDIRIKATLNADQRPETVEVSSKAGALVASYPAYKDYERYFVFHPTRMIQRSGGRIVLDVTLSAAFTNPYVAFPTPEQLAAAQ